MSTSLLQNWIPTLSSAAACVLIAGILPSTACAPSTIDGSAVISNDAEIEDSDDNRAIVEVIETYRRAMEDKDVGTLRRLVSNDYYENGGTTHTTEDDYGYDGLPLVFQRMAENVRQLRLQVAIHEIHIQGDRANVYLDWAYNVLYVVEGQERWQVDRDIDRFELVREGGEWRFVGGM